MVELELLQLGKHAVTVLGCGESGVGRRRGRWRILGAHERHGDEHHGGRREQRAEQQLRAQSSHPRERVAAAVPDREAALFPRVRPERDPGAAEEDEPGDPDQVHERLHERLEEERAVLVDLVGDQEEVLPVQLVGPDRGLVGDLLLGEVAVLAGLERPEPLAVARDLDDGSNLLGVRRPPLLRVDVAKA